MDTVELTCSSKKDIDDLTNNIEPEEKKDHDSENESSIRSRNKSWSRDREHNRLKNERSHSVETNKRKVRSRSPVRHRRGRSRSPMRRDKKNEFASRRKIPDKECRVFVTNLNFDTKWMHLKDLMKRGGNVEHVEIFTDDRFRSTGTAVCAFSAAESAIKAINELNGYELMGRKIKIKEDSMSTDKYQTLLKLEREKSMRQKSHPIIEHHPSVNNDGMGNPPCGPMGLLGGLGGLGTLFGLPTIQSKLFALLHCKTDELSSTVFVNNLDYDFNWQKLKDTFRRAGNCLRSDVTLDYDKRSKGYGTVIFETPIEALIAIAMFNKLDLGGQRPLAVRLDRLGSLNDILSQLGIDCNELNISSVMQLNTMATLALHASNNAAALGGLGGLGNLSNALDINKPPMNNMPPPPFGGGGIPPQFFNNHPPNNNNTNHVPMEPPRGGGGGMMNGRRDERSPPRKRRHSGSYNGGRDAPGGGNGGRRRRGSVDERREVDGVNDCKVFVRNLTFSTTWQTLKDKFREAGRVEHALIMSDDNKRSKGYGTVTFESKHDAMRAVDILNGCLLDGREIQVRMDWSRD